MEQQDSAGVQRVVRELREVRARCPIHLWQAALQGAFGGAAEEGAAPSAGSGVDRHHGAGGDGGADGGGADCGGGGGANPGPCWLSTVPHVLLLRALSWCSPRELARLESCGGAGRALVARAARQLARVATAAAPASAPTAPLPGAAGAAGSAGAAGAAGAAGGGTCEASPALARKLRPRLALESWASFARFAAARAAAARNALPGGPHQYHRALLACAGGGDGGEDPTCLLALGAGRRHVQAAGDDAAECFQWSFDFLRRLKCRVRCVAMSPRHAVVVTESVAPPCSGGGGGGGGMSGGTVLTVGSGENGTLGQGQGVVDVPSLRPVGLFSNTGVHALWAAASFCATAIVGADGTLYTCGYAADGQLGHGPHGPPSPVQAAQSPPPPPPPPPPPLPHGATSEVLEDVWVPTAVDSLLAGGVAVAHVAMGFDHTVVVGRCGGAWSCGLGALGRLGHGDEAARLLPTRIDALRWHGGGGGGGSGGCWAVAAAAGESHTLVLGMDGDLWAFGCGEGGRLGLGDESNQLLPKRVVGGALALAAVDGIATQRVAAVAAGSAHTAVVTAGGAALVWGRGDDKNLGTLRDDDELLPTPVHGLGACADIVEVSAGVEFTVWRRASGEVTVCGGEFDLYGSIPDQPDQRPRNVWCSTGLTHVRCDPEPEFACELC